jgi:hypothetical protein
MSLESQLATFLESKQKYDEESEFEANDSLGGGVVAAA